RPRLSGRFHAWHGHCVDAVVPSRETVSLSLAAILFLALLGSVLAWLIVGATERAGGLIATALPAGLFVALLSRWGSVTTGEVVTDSIAWAPSLGVAIDLRLDGFSFLFALLITGIGALVTLYAGSYF